MQVTINQRPEWFAAILADWHAEAIGAHLRSGTGLAHIVTSGSTLHIDLGREEAPVSESPSELQAIPLDDPILAPADGMVEPAVDPQLDLLPTNAMTWENFERLLLRLARDVLGLRSLSFFGKRGQAQKGLDVVGVNVDGRPEGIQAKWSRS
jgi:hypothetical protein